MFLVFEKTQKNVKNVGQPNVCSFKNHLITPVVNTDYTITESHWAKYVNGTRLLLATFYDFLTHHFQKKKRKKCVFLFEIWKYA